MGTGIHNAKVEGIKEGGELPRLCNFIAESAIRFLSKLSCRWRRSYRAAHHAGVEETVSSRKSVYTDPEEAETFVARTGCDSLAIAIGTSHGPCKFSGEARLDFERLDAIAARLPGVPLVLHGASSVPQEAVAAVNAHGGNVAGTSGVPEDLLRRAAASAICKINIDTDLRLAVTAAIRTLLTERPETFDPRAYLTAGREAVRGMVRHKIRAVLGSSGQA